MNSLWDRIRQRKVVQWALAYLAGGWLVLQVLDVLGQNLGMPPWVFRMTIALLAVGFLAALVLAWYHGEKGRQRVSGMEVLMLAGILLIAGAAVTLVRGDAGVGAGESPISAQADPASSTASGDPDVDVSEIRSLAVLPLENLSGDPDQKYFTAGMHEALTAELGQISALKVISRTSAMHYEDTDRRLPEIARELGVDGLIEGSVLRAGDEVRITLQLVHGPTDRHLWSESYERNLADILALQGEVAKVVARQIQVAVAPEEEARLAAHRVVDPEAYTLYLRGNHALRAEGERAGQRALAYYQQAIAADSTYAPAHAGLAAAYIRLTTWRSSQPSGVVRGPARAAALRAIELDSALAEGYIALARIEHLFEWDWAAAESAFRRGMSLDPSATQALINFSNYLISMGRPEEALPIARRVVERDPLSPRARIELGFVLQVLGRHRESLEENQQILRMWPDQTGIHIDLAHNFAAMGQVDEAVRHAERWESEFAGTEQPYQIARLGALYARLDRRREAVRILNHLESRAERDYVPPYALAILARALGEKEEALEHLEEAYAVRDPGMVWLARGFSDFRDEPRFQELLRKMDFPEG